MFPFTLWTAAVGKGTDFSGESFFPRRQSDMAPWIAFALGCASTFLLFVTYVAFDISEDTLMPPSQSPGSHFGGGFTYPMYNKGIVKVLNETFEARSLPVAVEAPPIGSALPPISGPLRVLTKTESADDARACAPLSSSVDHSIAVVRSGGCGIVTKLMNCQAAGAIGAIVEYDLLQSDDLALEAVRIPGLSVSPAAFKALSRVANAEASLWTIPQGFDLSTMDVLILLIVRPVMLFLIVSVILILNLGRGDAPHTATPKVVSALPRRRWSRADTSASRSQWSQDGCRVCLEDFVEDCEVMTLPCGHEFHAVCVSAWLLKQREVCPLCKQEVNRERIPLLV